MKTESFFPEQFEAFNIDHLELDSKHPGVVDKNYIARRQFFFNLARQHRLKGTVPDYIDFTKEEQTIWQFVCERLAVAHEQYGCQIYLQGKKHLNIQSHVIPQLHAINQRMHAFTPFQLIPAEGLLHPYSFFSYLSGHRMPCTQFLRHGKDPSYTPEPDMVHDFVGHVPPLTDPLYAEIIQLVGQGVCDADEQALTRWSRIYWYTIEFGLIEEKDQVKIFGAGLYSSYGEIQHVYSGKVEYKPFSIDEIVETDFDTTRMQDFLFVIPSLEVLKESIIRFAEK